MAWKPPSTRDKHPPSTTFDEMVTITVGKADTVRTFHVHKGLLCFYSGYFSRALTGQFLEASQKAIMLDTEDAHIFMKFQQWLYTRRLCEETETATRVVPWNDIMKLWIFGDARDIPLLQNEVIDLLRNKSVDLWQGPAAQIPLIYSSTTPGCPLRRFAIDLVAKASGPAMLKEEDMQERWSKEAVVDLARTAWKPIALTWNKTDLEKLDICQYHVHDAGVKCSSGNTMKRKAETEAKREDGK